MKTRIKLFQARLCCLLWLLCAGAGNGFAFGVTVTDGVTMYGVLLMGTP